MSWLYSPLLPGAAQQEAGAGATIVEAAFSAAGAATALFAAAAIASSVAFAAGAGEAQAIGAFDGQAPEEAQPEPADSIPGGGGTFGHPDLIGAKKKRKPRLIRMGEQGESSQDADAQAESDFRLLWEAVKIRNDAGRMRAAIEKRNAILADLEKAAGIRTRSQG
jgi:hypothetical protein